MKKIMLSAAVLMMLSHAVVAGPAQTRQILVDVNGMVCDFCAQSLKKIFLKQPGVQAIDVSLAEKLVTISMKPDGKMLPETTVRKLVEDSGYAVAAIRYDEAEAR